MKKCNIFIVHTEYHVLLTVSIIYSQYFDYDNHIYVTLSDRLKTVGPISNPSIKIHLLNKGYNVKNLLYEIEEYKPERFFFYQDNSEFNMYLCYNLSKKGTIIALVQDGLKPYIKWKKSHEVLSTIKDTIISYYNLIKHHAVLNSIVWMCFYDYGDWKFINELWLTHPDAFNNKHHKQLIKIPNPTSKALSVLNELFEYSGEDNLKSIVLIIGQPATNCQSWQFDASLVNDIVKKFSQHKVLYKPHPLTNPDHFDMIRNIKQENFQIYTNKVPAELIILQMMDSIIISRNSTSMLMHNNKCKYYWTHQMFPKDKVSSQLETINPTTHILEISSINEITF